MIQLVGGLRAGMGYRMRNYSGLQRNVRIIHIAQPASRESHVHDVAITKNARTTAQGKLRS